MSTGVIDAAPGRLSQVASGTAVGLGASVLAYCALGSQAGPSDGWIVALLLVVTVGFGGLVVSRSSRWHTFGVTLAVVSVAPFVLLFIVLALIGLAIGS